MNRMTRVMITVLLWGCIFSVQAVQAMDNGRSLYFSVIPKKNLDQQIAELHPLLDLLEKRLNRSIKIVRPQSYQSVIEGLVSHSIDFGVLGPASYAYAKRRDDRIDAFASFMMKNGYATSRGEYYNSILITSKQTGFSTIDDLRGKNVALIDPVSTSGSLIPNMEFSKIIGEPLQRFFAKQIYTGAHDRSVEAVTTGRIDAAFVASSRLDEEIRKGVVNGNDICILWRSQPIHYDPFVFGSSLDDDLRDEIRAVFFSRDPSLTLLYENMQVKGLIPVEDQDYQPIHDIVAREQQENKSSLK